MKAKESNKKKEKCKDLMDKKKKLQKKIKEPNISKKEKDLYREQIRILEDQWNCECAPKGKVAKRVG